MSILDQIKQINSEYKFFPACAKLEKNGEYRVKIQKLELVDPVSIFHADEKKVLQIVFDIVETTDVAVDDDITYMLHKKLTSNFANALKMLMQEHEYTEFDLPFECMLKNFWYQSGTSQNYELIVQDI